MANDENLRTCLFWKFLSSSMSVSKFQSLGRLHWEVNSLVVRDGTYFGYGWVFHEIKKIRDLRLIVKFDDDDNQAVLAGFEKFKDNAATTSPFSTTTSNSGFFLLGSCNQGKRKYSDLFLQVTLEDDVVIDLNIPPDRIKSYDADNLASERISMRQPASFLRRNASLIKRLQVSDLLAKVKYYFSNRPSSHLVNVGAIQQLLEASELRNVVLVIDHDLGGGANQYRERMVADKINEDKTVLVFSCYLATLSYVLMIRSKQRNERFTISGYDFLLELPGALEIREVIYNTGASLVAPEELPLLIAKLKNRYSFRLTLLVHDYFMICPSHYLLDDAGKYCGIPDISRCQSCLINNQQDFSSLFLSRDIHQWRALWGNVIGLADEVRCFSEDSLKLLQKAYPALNASCAVVRPHLVQYLRHGKIHPSYTTSLRIGVVGNIGYHKGAKVVQCLAYEITARKLDIQIVVIGTIEAQCEPTVVRQTGPYQHDNLVSLIETAGVNIMLFPSIWPETFSYVVQELIELDLPVACYGLGAPVERVSNYAKGMILKDATPSATLDDLISFHRQIYPTRSL